LKSDNEKTNTPHRQHNIFPLQIFARTARYHSLRKPVICLNSTLGPD